MPTIKVPSPLRSYTNGQAEVPVQGITVAAAMDDFITIYPSLQPHLFNSKGELRPFVNLFLNSQDVRHMQGLETPLADDDRLMIVPSIAGGLEQVDHAALRTNQAFIIALSLLAFILDQPWLAAFVAGMMILGTILRVPRLDLFTGESSGRWAGSRRRCSRTILSRTALPRALAQRCLR